MNLNQSDGNDDETIIYDESKTSSENTPDNSVIFEYADRRKKLSFSVSTWVSIVLINVVTQGLPNFTFKQNSDCTLPQIVKELVP